MNEDLKTKLNLVNTEFYRLKDMMDKNKSDPNKTENLGKLKQIRRDLVEKATRKWSCSR